jgi:hypothetical protein
MGQLNIKDEALIAEAKALAELMGTSTTEAVRRAVHERLVRERAESEAARQRKFDAIMGAARRFREASPTPAMSNADLDALLYDPATGLPR